MTSLKLDHKHTWHVYTLWVNLGRESRDDPLLAVCCADYIGCMKTGQVFRDPHLRWFEPQNSLIGGKSYFTHAWGSVYVLSKHAASILATLSSAAPQGLRFFINEGPASIHSPAWLFQAALTCFPRALSAQAIADPGAMTHWSICSAFPGSPECQWPGSPKVWDGLQLLSTTGLPHYGLELW